MSARTRKHPLTAVEQAEQGGRHLRELGLLDDEDLHDQQHEGSQGQHAARAQAPGLEVGQACHGGAQHGGEGGHQGWGRGHALRHLPAGDEAVVLLRGLERDEHQHAQEGQCARCYGARPRRAQQHAEQQAVGELGAALLLLLVLGFVWIAAAGGRGGRGRRLLCCLMLLLP